MSSDNSENFGLDDDPFMKSLPSRQPKNVDSSLMHSAEGSLLDCEEDPPGFGVNANDQKKKIAYVPVAMVITTEIENHDIFRGILCELFNSIREEPKDDCTQ